MLLKIKNILHEIVFPTKELETNKNSWQYIIGVIILFCCSIKLYYGIQNTVDIQYADEAAYLRYGLNLFGNLNRNWGPLYTIWYKLLSYITTDTISLYYINFVTASIFIGILLYIFLLRISVNYVLALLISFSILVSDLNVSVWPRISHFCITLCLAALIFITYIKNRTYQFLVFTTLCLVISYARPEFYLSFVLLTLITFLCMIYNRKSYTKKDIPIFLGTVIIIVILHLIFRFPSNDFFGYNRGVAAFYQHYAWNYKKRTHDYSIDAWLYWEDIARKQFGDCNSMWCVIKSQPIVFISNTLFNIRNYILSILVHVFTYIFPISIFHGNKIKILITSILFITFIYLLIKKDSRNYFLNQINKYKFYLVILLVFCLPTIASCIIIYPRDHYLYLQMTFVILILSSAFGYFFKDFSMKPIVFIAFGIALFLSTPNINKYKFLLVSNKPSNLCNKELIRYLEKNYSNKPHTVFTNLPFVTGMLPTTFKEINTIFDKKENVPFIHYMDSAKLDIVIILPSIFRDPHLKTDSTWNYFINNYEKYHFKKDKFSDCETYLLVKQE